MRVLRHLVIFAVVLLFAGSDVRAQDVTWRFFSVSPASHDYAKAIAEGFGRIEQRSAGRFKVRLVNFSETPYKPSDALQLIRDGLVESTEWTPSYTAGTYPMLVVPELPFISPTYPDAAGFQAATNAAWNTPTVQQHLGRLLDQHKAMNLGRWYYEPLNYWFTKPVESAKDFTGKKIRVASPEAAEMASALGGSPVQIFPAEVYTALQRGTIDGVVTGSGNIRAFKWNDVLRSVYVANLVLVSSSFVISKDAFAKLTPELQSILKEEMAAVAANIQRLMPEKDKAQLDSLTAAGMTLVKPSAETYATFRTLAEEKVWSAWKSRAGGDADKALAEIKAVKP